jgi:ankyrin repeat protein
MVLLHAERARHEGAVKLLLIQRSAQADSKDKGGQSPLACAAENGHEAGVVSRRG